jgi:hypothetical protein
MRWREFIALFGGAVAWPLAARAQQSALPVIGFVTGRSPEDSVRFGMAFGKGLSEAGIIDGQNATVEYHWLDGQYDQPPLLMAISSAAASRPLPYLAVRPRSRPSPRPTRYRSSSASSKTRSSSASQRALRDRAETQPGSILSWRGCVEAAWPPA